MLKVLVVILFSALFLGVGYEQVSRSLAEQRHPYAGDMVRVNGHSLHVVVKGSGRPTVVFESGIDPGGHLSWGPVQDPVTAFSTTISYDRSGVLWSELGDRDKTCDSMASDLEALLTTTGVPEPYILVGHSAAALIFRCFVSRNAGRVAGIVLVDPSHPDLLTQLPDEVVNDALPLPPWLANLLNQLGVVRLINRFSYPGLHPNDAINRRVQALSGRGLEGVYLEMNGAKQLASDASRAPDFGALPLVVVSGAKAGRFDNVVDEPAIARRADEAWERLQGESAALSEQGRRVISPDSGHYVQLEDPELVVEIIKSMAESWRVAGPATKDRED